VEPTSEELLLAAYLDGELPSSERHRLEERLAREPELRQQLTLLEQTWHYLDLLEKEPSDEEHVETTLKLAAVSVSAVPPAAQNRHLRRFFTGSILWAAVFFGAFFLGERFASDDPFFNLAVERLDMYLTVQDDGIELLRQLAEKRVFLPPLPDGESAGTPGEFIPTNQYGFWSSKVMTDPQNESGKTESRYLYQKNLQKFRDMTWVKKEQIRKLHWDIEHAPRKRELVLTLQNYYYWQKSLQSYERTELRRPKRMDEKVADIAALKAKLEKQLPQYSTGSSSEIVVNDENTIKRLAELAACLSDMPIRQKERLLDEPPEQIIDFLDRYLRGQGGSPDQNEFN
jgi:hypothetical protein